jgi:hypothetical protein
LIVWAQSRLIPILRSVDAIDELVPLHDGEVDADYDVDAEVMELPFVFRTTPDRIPCEVPYLDPGPRRRCDSARPAVGIVWAAGDWAPQRSMTLRDIQPLLGVDVAWHILQHGPARGQCPNGLGQRPDVSSIVETARVMRDLDLVITVDSMPAHLAGALGVPVWTLLPATADWRWMSARADTPWYPTMRLLRQRRDGDWHELTRRTARELRIWASHRREPRTLWKPLEPGTVLEPLGT